MQIIALFDTEYKLVASIDQQNGVLQTHYFDTSFESLLSPVLNEVLHMPLFVPQELFDAQNTSYLVEHPVDSTHALYLEAVAHALRSRRFVASLLQSELMEYVLLTRDESLDSLVRRELVVTLVNIAPGDARQLEEARTTIKPILDDLRKNREEWKKTLDQKTEEILGNT